MGRTRRGVLVLAVAAALPAPAGEVKEAGLRAHLEFLAGDALQGRGSGTRDEWLAAAYAGSQLRQAGLEPKGDAGSYLQRVEGEAPTWNVLASLPGADPQAAAQVVLLSAHLDHLGMRPNGAGDRVFNGADDDASGVAAVLELARALAEGPRPRRTVVVALFGSEENGGAGARHFLEHPPVPLESIVANVEFEMVGRPDSKLRPRQVWMAGFDRSDLGPTLAAHGAPLVADPRPDQRFFERSDNIALARRGVVAHSVSSFGLHADYHQVADDVSRIDFAHLTAVIDALVSPLRWLANDGYRPTWLPGKRPAPTEGLRRQRK